MNQTLDLTPVELQKAGWNVLKNNLGIPTALKFLLQYEKGEGNYTELRKKIYKDETVDSLIGKMKKKKHIK